MNPLLLLLYANYCPGCYQFDGSVTSGEELPRLPIHANCLCIMPMCGDQEPDDSAKGGIDHEHTGD